MFAKFTYKWITLILCLITVTTACASAPPSPVDGDVVNLFYGTSRYIVNQAGMLQSGTQLFESSELYVFARGYSQGFGFVPVDKATLEVVNDPGVLRGNLVNLKTWQEFRDFLTSHGFEILQSVPAAVQAFVASTANTLTTFYVLPAGALGEDGYFNDTFLAPYEGTNQQ